MNEHEDLGPLFVKAFHQFIDPPEVEWEELSNQISVYMDSYDFDQERVIQTLLNMKNRVELNHMGKKYYL